MSEPRIISPMLDGCIIGEAISCHNGVRCCPAIRESTGEKYIVKIISIPASQIQLEALLLTGAYENSDAAAAYFMELAEDILKEKDILASLSRMEGFTGYLDAQIIPLEEGIGYEVYLLSPYKRSVERMLATDTLTHLGVVNMGLDICAALAACRRAGYLYVDLKPENIFFTSEQDYRIGDLGFVPLSSLRYTTLAEKYHSPYAPAEVLDTMAVLNDTVDVYALGLVLYQAYNRGQLPQLSEDGTLPAPLYADYEMAEIILKACAADPADRWADPSQMGQALVGYMQRNTVNDDPIIPPVLEPSEEETEVQEPDETEEVEEFLPETEPEPEELAFLQELTQDETAPSEENTENLEDAPVTEETSQMLAQADDLLAVELPEPVVAPEAPEVPMPEPIEVPMPQLPSTEPEEAEETTEEADADAEEPAEAAEEVEPAEEPQQEIIPEEAPDAPKKPKHNIKAIVATLLVLITLACAAIGGWYYYENFYLQEIESITVDGTESMLTVHVHSGVSDELLTVYCVDSYGNAVSSPVTAGVAVFQGLNPSTRYSIRVEISGLHKLTGTTTSSFTTEAQITIKDFHAVIGATDGSALLSFSVAGTNNNNWMVTYSAEGIPEKSVSFTGHSVSITDLVIGTEYSFRLSNTDGLYLAGTTQTTLKAGKLIFAKDLMITACGGGALSIRWNAPEGEAVDLWTIRCYNESGYNETVTTSDLTYTFNGIDHSSPCTVEVFAENMSQSAFVTVNANPITISNFTFDNSIPGLLKLRWDFEGKAPEGGWILSYTTDGMSQDTLYVTQTAVDLYVIPGSHYEVTLQAANGATVFGGATEYELAEAPRFEGYGLTLGDIQSSLCLRPEATYWSAADVAAEAYTNTFAVGQRAGMVLQALKDFESSQDNIRVTYLIHNSEGKLINVSTANSLWSNIMPGEYGAINISYMPDVAGEYTLTIYFNGKLVTVQNFSIV